MGKKIELTGQRFGMLIVIQECEKRVYTGQVLWQCLCDCGNTKDINSHRLVHGLAKNCGCVSRERSRRMMNKLNSSGLAGHGNPLTTKEGLFKVQEGHRNKDVAFKTNVTTGIKNISFRNNEGVFQVKITRFQKTYFQRFSKLSEAINAKEYVLSRYKKGISNWNDKI